MKFGLLQLRKFIISSEKFVYCGNSRDITTTSSFDGLQYVLNDTGCRNLTLFRSKFDGLSTTESICSVSIVFCSLKYFALKLISVEIFYIDASADGYISQHCIKNIGVGREIQCRV